jgi:hypothetical protein
MIEERFVLTSNAFEGEIELAFALNGHLTRFHNRAELNEKQVVFFSANFPMTVTAANVLIGKAKSMKAVYIPAELTFTAFWEAYSYKVGNRKRAEKLWDKMTDGQRLKALTCIAEYDKYLARKKSMEKLYPETFLAQERYETDFKKLK